MHDSMPSIQGQGHRASEVMKIALFKLYLLHHLHWELANDHQFLNYGTISKFYWAGFLIFVLYFVLRDFKLGRCTIVSHMT